MPTPSTMTRPGTRSRLASSEASRAPESRAPVMSSMRPSDIRSAEVCLPGKDENETHFLLGSPAAMFDAFDLPFVQRGLWEVLLLAVPAGLLGTWIVLRGMAFFAHATGTASFPGLVLADGLGFGAPLGAAGAAAVFAGAVVLLGGRRRTGGASLVALVLVGCLAAGVLLASDVFGSGARVDTLLFGSLLVLEPGDLVLAAVAGVLAAVGSTLLGERWLARGFDPDAARALGLRSRWPDLVLAGLIAFAVVASLAAVGALLVTALFVVPAATARLVVRRLRPWQWASIGLAAAERAAGLWLAVETNAPPGAAIAVVAGVVFALVAIGRALPPAA